MSSEQTFFQNQRLRKFIKKLIRCLNVVVIRGKLYVRGTAFTSARRVPTFEEIPMAKILRVGILRGLYLLEPPKYTVVYCATPVSTWSSGTFTRLFFFLPGPYWDMELCIDLDTSDEKFRSTLAGSVGCSAYFSEKTGGYEVAIEKFETRFTAGSMMVHQKMMHHLLGRRVEYETDPNNLALIQHILESLRSSAGEARSTCLSMQNSKILERYMRKVFDHIERTRHRDDDYGFAMVHLGRHFFELWNQVLLSGHEPFDGSQYLADIDEIIKNWREGIATIEDWRKPVECAPEEEYDSAEEEENRFYRRWAEENRREDCKIELDEF